MIMTSKRLIERESTALSRVFEMNGKRLGLLIDNNQQFAMTFDLQQDKRNHLDITNAVSAVQKMLTALSNRCLEIRTLTSGEGVVISKKDLEETMRDLCRSIIKNNEISMRTRVEQLSLTILQYENMLYSKDQHLLNLESKLCHAKEELNRIVGTKVFTRGNALIYELDHTTRQLRLMKDNIYTLEKILKEKIKLRYDKDLEATRLELKEQKRKFFEFQNALQSNMTNEVKLNISQIDEVIKKRIKGYSDISEDTPEARKEDDSNTYGHLLRGEARHQYMQMRAAKALGKEKDISQDHGGVFKNEDLEEVFDDFRRLKANESESRQEVLKLQEFIRKQRLMQNLKWALFKQ